MIADRGQPQNRSVAADGTITYIYAAEGFNLTQIQTQDGKIVSVSDLAASLGDKKDELLVRTHYVYSPDGVLQKILLDLPGVGPNGEIVHHLEDTSGMQIKITGRHKVEQ